MALTLINLVGADKIDVGNYKSGAGFAISLFAQCAAEFGETELARDLLDHLQNDLHPIVPSPHGHGAIMNEGLSMIGCMNIFKARVMKQGDWESLITSYPDKAVLAAPKLDDVPFPDVMVARCYPEGKTGLNFVLRGPENGGEFAIGFKDLKLKTNYQLNLVNQNDKKVVVGGMQADEDGKARVRVSVAFRSEFELVAIN